MREMYTHPKGWHMVYLAVATHGTLIYERLHKTVADEQMAQRIRAMLHTGKHTVCMAIPNRIDLECSTHAGEYEQYGVPCVSFSVQSNTPAIPRQWQAHYHALCAMCYHSRLHMRCMCSCHA